MKPTTEFTKEDTLAVKGLAVLCLLFYHLFEHYERVTTMQVDYSPFSLDLFLLISSFGNICVAVFAFLSAYGITKGILTEKQTDWKYMYRRSVGRYLKLTANFVAMFISVNLLWFSKFDYVNLYGKGWQGMLYGFLDMFGLSGMFKTPTINATWWYMELAIMIIFFVPLLLAVAKKIGNYALILAVLMPAAVTLSVDVKRYYFVMLFGVLAAAGNWFEKLFSLKIPRVLEYVLGIVLFGACILVRQNYVVYNEFAYLLDAPIALFFSWFTKRLWADIWGVRQVLRFLGKHSMNIYFVHTFFYLAIYQEFIYSFQYAGIIFLVLIGVSLLYSVLLEGVKKLLRFEGVMARINKHFS